MNVEYPSSSGWQKLLNHILIETVEFDENGHYDAEKHPDFYDWMETG